MEYFIERQQLVAQAMLDLGLDLNEMAKYGDLAWCPTFENGPGKLVKSADLLAGFAESDDLERRSWYEVAKRATERNLSQSGIWIDKDRNEWEYYLHGQGCMLVNKLTGEPIDWDAPDVKSYKLFFFWRHLIWQLRYPKRALQLGYVYLWVTNSLEPLMLEAIKEMPKTNV